MRLKEALGQLKFHELRLHKRNSRNEAHALEDVIFDKMRKWIFMEKQPSEGIELSVSSINLGFENPSMRMEEGEENPEGVLQDMSSNEEVGQGEGSTSTSNEVIPRF